MTGEIIESSAISAGASTGYQTNVTQKSFDELKQDVLKLEGDLKDAKKDFEKSRFDLITVLSVFVGFITFLGLEVQVFRLIHNPLMIIGISIFFIASILLFVLTINVILSLGRVAWICFSSVLYLILIMLLLGSIYYITSGYTDYLNAKNYSNVNKKLKSATAKKHFSVRDNRSPLPTSVKQ